MKKQIYIILLLFASLYARAQDPAPSSPKLINPNFTWYSNIAGTDTVPYSKTGATWTAWARQHWVNKYYSKKSDTVRRNARMDSIKNTLMPITGSAFDLDLNSHSINNAVYVHTANIYGNPSGTSVGLGINANARDGIKLIGILHADIADFNDENTGADNPNINFYQPLSLPVLPANGYPYNILIQDTSSADRFIRKIALSTLLAGYIPYSDTSTKIATRYYLQHYAGTFYGTPTFQNGLNINGLSYLNDIVYAGSDIYTGNNSKVAFRNNVGTVTHSFHDPGVGGFLWLTDEGTGDITVFKGGTIQDYNSGKYYLKQGDAVAYADTNSTIATRYYLQHYAGTFYGTPTFNNGLKSNSEVFVHEAAGGMTITNTGGGLDSLEYTGHGITNQITGAYVQFPATSNTLLYGAADHYFEAGSTTLLHLGINNNWFPYLQVYQKPAQPNDVENKRSVDSLLIKKADSTALYNLKLPTYAKAADSINAAINSRYIARSQSITWPAAATLDAMTTLTPTDGTWTSTFASDAIAIDGTEADIKLTRASTSPTDVGYSAITKTFSSNKDYSGYDVFDVDYKAASYQQQIANSFITLTDSHGVSVSIKSAAPTRFTGTYLTVSYDKKYIDLPTGGSSFDWTSVAAVKLYFEVKQLGWYVYFKNFRASKWLQLSYTNLDTYGMAVNGDTTTVNYIADFKAGKVRGNSLGNLTPGSTYTCNYYTGGGTVVIPKGWNAVTRQILLRSNLNLVFPENKYTDGLINNITNWDKVETPSGYPSTYPVLTNKDWNRGLYNTTVSIGLNAQAQETGARIDGIDIYSNSTNSYINNYYGVRDVNINNCFITDAIRGIMFHCDWVNPVPLSSFIIENNRLENCYNQFIEVYNGGGQIVNNTANHTDGFQNAAMGSNGGALHVLQFCNTIEVGGNDFRKTYTGENVSSGVQHYYSHDNHFDYVTFAFTGNEEPTGNSSNLDWKMVNNTYTAWRKNQSGTAVSFVASSTNHTSSVFDNITFDNCDFERGYQIFAMGNPGYTYQETNFTIKNCRFNAAHDAFNIADPNISYLTIDGNYFADCDAQFSAATHIFFKNNKAFPVNYQGNWLNATAGQFDYIGGNISTGTGTSGEIGLNITSTATAKLIENNIISGYNTNLRLNSGTGTHINGGSYTNATGSNIVINTASNILNNVTATNATSYGISFAASLTGNVMNLGDYSGNTSGAILNQNGQAVFNVVGITTATLPLLHIVSNSSSPTIAAGSGAGTGPTVSLSTGSTDASGVITIVTGTSPFANATIATITYNTAYTTAATPVVSCQGGTTAIGVGVAGTSSFTIYGTLAASTTYKFNYVVIGK